ncbi:mannonate dehydratase [Nocardioides panzhihuensis]|uniref:mannonate dehydratase n=1 Tax=Nocardioides panzhihuensis TaxID=860243 RepID=A0A7Z0IR40_9ACTN|nr:mannonate dehydratase [Nocardioides panzhihuensis]NYI76609.1 mannonate dehydratase [Nocardioides panzhihuensis]
MTDHSRRSVLKLSAAAAAASAAAVHVPGSASAAERRPGPYPDVTWPGEVAEGPDTPKLCQWFSRNPDEATVRRWRQAGVTGALVTNPPPLPWSAETLRADRDRLESQGLHITAYLIAVSQSIVQGTAARDADLEKVIASVRAAGEAGIPVVEYNWYIHRLTEGYYEQVDQTDRIGAGYTAFDADREVDGVKVRDLPPRDGTPVYTREQLWENYAYFLERVVPVAEEAGVRLAVHPNDPPYQVSRGNPQIMGSVPDWQRMVETVDSPSNGMTVHSGVTAEVGFDSVSFLRWMARKDRVNHIHYRNVVVEEPFVRYAEVFPDNGETDMFAFMRELVRSGYHLGVLAEHPRALDFDRENGSIGGQYADVGGGGHGGELYDTGYARAMLQAAMITEKHR